jgi:hypothetical protein
MTDSSLLDSIADRVYGRYYGKYRGVVTEVEPSTMRIKATVPAVLLDRDSGWCTPCVPFAGPQTGFCFLPEVGAGVWIEFEGGDPSFPIWSGCFWFADDVPSDIGEKRRAIITGAPHSLVFDDDEGITITDSNDSKLEFASGAITASNGGGASVELDGASVKLNGTALEVT